MLGHCWHLASPRRVSGSQVVVRVLMLAWIFAFVVFRALAAPIAVVMVAESGFFNVLASVRELAALTAGFFGCVLCILVAAVLFWGRQGWGLGIPPPHLGCPFLQASEEIVIFSGRPLLDLFSYSALFGSTVLHVGSLCGWFCW